MSTLAQVLIGVIVGLGGYRVLRRHGKVFANPEMRLKGVGAALLFAVLAGFAIEMTEWLTR